MNVSLPSEERSTVLIVATMIAVMGWYSTSLTGVSLITNIVIVWLVTAAAMIVGLRIFN